MILAGFNSVQLDLHSICYDCGCLQKHRAWSPEHQWQKNPTLFNKKLKAEGWGSHCATMESAIPVKDKERRRERLAVMWRYKVSLCVLLCWILKTLWLPLKKLSPHLGLLSHVLIRRDSKVLTLESALILSTWRYAGSVIKKKWFHFAGVKESTYCGAHCNNGGCSSVKFILLLHCQGPFVKMLLDHLRMNRGKDFNLLNQLLDIFDFAVLHTVSESLFFGLTAHSWLVFCFVLLEIRACSRCLYI